MHQVSNNSLGFFLWTNRHFCDMLCPMKPSISNGTLFILDTNPEIKVMERGINNRDIFRGPVPLLREDYHTDIIPRFRAQALGEKDKVLAYKGISPVAELTNGRTEPEFEVRRDDARLVLNAALGTILEKSFYR